MTASGREASEQGEDRSGGKPTPAPRVRFPPLQVCAADDCATLTDRRRCGEHRSPPKKKKACRA
jgi:hypothetical protein